MPTTLPSAFTCSARNRSRVQSPLSIFVAIGLLVLPAALIALLYAMSSFLDGGNIPWDIINDIYQTTM
jgi:hypothetical protein